MARVVRRPGPGAERLRIALEALDGKVGKVGWFESAVYPDGTQAAYVAAIHEYGYPEGGIPPRLGMRETADAKRGEWAGVAAQGAKAILEGKATAGAVMEAVGLKAAGDMRKRIATVQTPPLKPDTIRARQRQRADKKTVGNLTKPLVDTGFLLGSLTNTVEDS